MRLTQADLPDLKFDRIRAHTTDSANQKIDQQTHQHLQEALMGGPAAIQRRLRKLDQEWDIDRVLTLNFAAFVFAQHLAARKNPRWIWGPLPQAALLTMHAVVGWCPPSLWFRPMGFRTRHEIRAERDILISQLSRSVS